jgi:hypothetical protein
VATRILDGKEMNLGAAFNYLVGNAYFEIGDQILGLLFMDKAVACDPEVFKIRISGIDKYLKSDA